MIVSMMELGRRDCGEPRVEGRWDFHVQDHCTSNYVGMCMITYKHVQIHEACIAGMKTFTERQNERPIFL